MLIMILVAIMIALVAGGILYIVVYGTGDQAIDDTGQAVDQTEQGLGEQQQGVLERLQQSLQEGITLKGIPIPGGSSGTGGGGTSPSQTGTETGGPSGTDGTNEQEGFGEMEGAVIVHFSPTSQVGDFQQRMDAYQNGIEQHTPFGDQCPIEYQTDDSGDQSNADIVFTVSHEYPSDRGGDLIPSVQSEDLTQATGTLYAGFTQDGSSTDFGSEVHGIIAAHETLHEFRFCEEYSESAWIHGNQEVYNSAGGCINPWNRPMYDADTSESQCSSEPVPADQRTTDPTCGTPTTGGYSVMGAPRVADSGGVLVPTELAQNGLPNEDIEPLKQFIEEHTGVTCR